MSDYNINAVTRRVVFTGSAGLGPYSFTFEVLDQNDLAVYFNTTKLTLTTDYSVTINANGTGSVTIVTGTNVPTTPDADDTVIIVGARDIERTTDFVTAGDLRASALNEQLDGLTIFDQQIAEEQKRTLQAPVFDPAHVDDGGTLDMTLPAKAARAGKYLQFNSTTGNPEAGPDSTDVTALADIATDIATLADIEDGTDATDAIQTVAGISANVTTVAGISGNVTTVAGIQSDVTAVAADATDIGTVATDIANVNTTAGSIANVNTVAGAVSNVNTVATDIANVNTTAANITDVNTFAVRYRIGATDPSTSLDEGDLFFNTTDNTLKYYNGSSWTAVASDGNDVAGVSSNDTTPGYLNGKLVAGSNITLTENNDGGNETLTIAGASGEVVDDTTPQLGGDLDVNGNSIVSVSNGDINITPNGTGNVSLGNFTFDADQSVGAGQDNYLMTYDNGSGTISLEAAPAGGAGYFQGENGATGDTTNGKGDIFRVHEQQLDTNTTIASGDNAGAFFSLTVATGVTLTVNGNLVIA